MENWKNIGSFLTGFAALLTALIGLISYVHDLKPEKPQLQVQKKNIQIAFVNDPDGWVNLRSGTSSNSSVLTTLDNGDIVEILKKDGNWFRVKTNQNMVGYIYFDRLELIYDEHNIQ